MPRIFDNIDRDLLPALRGSLEVSTRADFCVGYFNLRGWRQVADLVEVYPGTEGLQCRLLVCMQKLPEGELRVTPGPSFKGGHSPPYLRIHDIHGLSNSHDGHGIAIAMLRG